MKFITRKINATTAEFEKFDLVPIATKNNMWIISNIIVAFLYFNSKFILKNLLRIIETIVTTRPQKPKKVTTDWLLSDASPVKL
jgi:hypothetical protein